MQLYHVVAMALNRVIGKDNRLPWHFSSDLKHFKELTFGSTVIMGRKTFESIGKPLPGRENFVISRSHSESYSCHSEDPERREGDEESQRSFASLRMTKPSEHLHYFNSIEKAIQSVKTPKAFIIGGAQIFKETISRVDGIYLTQIEKEYEGDRFYPEIPSPFREQSRKALQDQPKVEVIFYQNVQRLKKGTEDEATF